MRLVICMLLLCCTTVGFAMERIQLYAGEARVVAVDAPRKVAVGDPKVADVQVLSDKEILLSAKKPGSTSLIIWSRDGGKDTTEVSVTGVLQERTMVEINVQMLEINRKNLADLGVDWPSILEGKDAETGLSPATPLHVAEQSDPPLFNWGRFERGNLDARLHAMVQKGTAKLLAKPKLLAVSGTSASFLAGGEIPVVNQDAQGKTSVSWKSYGVTLDVEPTADAQGNVSALIRAEVSNPDATQAVRLPNGTYMPALRTRWAKTQVYVKRGGTVVMAGLIQNEDLHSTSGVPFLGDIPLFGELFKTHHVETLETELIVFVTPTVVGVK